MKNVIVQLWNGELCPVSKSGLNNEEQRKLEALVHNARMELEESLLAEQQELLDAYISCQAKLLCIRDDQAFLDGYSLGTRITAEALLELEKE